MSGLKGMVKDGWHPKGKEGGRESWRGDFKGINQVAGWVGKGKSSDASQRSEHVPRPLSTLKDPSSFAPPPRRANTAGAASYTPPVSSRQHQVEESAPAQPGPPPVPYRADTTGLSTRHFPTPPTRQGDSSHQGHSSTAKTMPSLPPRLPPRRSSPNLSPQTSPPPYEAVAAPKNAESYLNQGAMNRLANAGVSVPAFGIQRQGSSNSYLPNTGRTAASTDNTTNELQARFSRLNPSPSSAISSIPSNTPSPIQGVTSQQLQTAATAASHVASQPAVQQHISHQTSANEYHPGLPARANSFRERHDDQIQAVKGKLNGFNQKYGITKRINDFIEDQKSPAHPDPPAPAPPPGHVAVQAPSPHHPYSSPNTSRPDLDALNKRKPPPPPPPPKKPSLHSRPVNHSPSPPPLPLNTKPR
ncbi:predicted protein [Uncinocarpus reesii 1704]|uniref:Uncharacterized protein n=1 Tax=Uncinocarpus reesii (strain UAMH 1704) TaxID=336963 RepID=C4JIR3_UNCRE|nr:uncharacterized protein UREG_02924 [Uncinocarpus reesii 1704]EEP78075.1 predicted protein [Uncinocarpus reesii 1704]